MRQLRLLLLLSLPCLFLVRGLSPPIRAVNLGGWLVTEGWIQPSLFDGIPNKDFLDGAKLQFKSVTQNMYLAAEHGGGTIIVANRTTASGWETFKLWRINETIFNLKVFNNQFMTIASDGVTVVAMVSSPGPREAFQIVRNDTNKNLVRIRASNGKFLQAKTKDLVTADYVKTTNWGNNDPSVFAINITTPQGEYQICNGYGKTKATEVLREDILAIAITSNMVQKHWSTYIVENDFSFISTSGLNAVRIPVGWWIASGPNPPAPFIGGSLQALDNAFIWAKKYNVGVIIDLHAAPGSQNPFEHSASRDGSQDWGTDASIAQTVQVIDFLSSRYANSSSLLAVELLNEPLAPGVSLQILKKYYQDGYNAVRKYTATAYVIMSNRLSAANSTELLDFASGFSGAVIDVHYYNLYTSFFNDLTVEQNIEFVRTNRSTELSTITRQNGPLTFVGEWVAEWNVRGASKEDYQKFAQIQLDVYGQAIFGWAYWTLKNVYDHWSMEWMIKNGYISLKN